MTQHKKKINEIQKINLRWRQMKRVLFELAVEAPTLFNPIKPELFQASAG